MVGHSRKDEDGSELVSCTATVRDVRPRLRVNGHDANARAVPRPTQRSRVVRDRSQSSDVRTCPQPVTQEASPRFPGNWPLTCDDTGSGGRI